MTDDIKCPVCSSKTILRTAKKGPYAGKKFHVCVNHPKCKGKVEQAKANRLIGRIKGNHESSIRILERSKRFNLKNPLKKSNSYLGVFIAVLLTYSTYFIVGAIPHISSATWGIITLSMIPISYLIGGLIAGGMAGYRGSDHGMRAAQITCVIHFIVFNIIFIVIIIGGDLYISGSIIVDLIVGIIGSIFGLFFALLIAMILGGLGGALGAWLRNR